VSGAGAKQGNITPALSPRLARPQVFQFLLILKQADAFGDYKQASTHTDRQVEVFIKLLSEPPK